MKTGIITEIVKTREYPYQDKTYYASTLKLDNGDTGECSKSKPDFFTVGQSITYEITDGQYGKKIKLEQTQQTKQGKSTRQKEDPIEKFIGFAFAYSKDLALAGVIQRSEIVKEAHNLFTGMKELLSDNKPVQATQTQQTIPVAQSSTSELITPEQIKYAHTLWGKTGLNDEAWKKYISDTYKVSSSKELTKHQASEFIEYIKTIEPLPLPTKPVDDDLPF